MKRLVENPSLREDLGEKLYETVKDTYSLKNVCNDRVEFLKTINKKLNYKLCIICLNEFTKRTVG